MLIQHNMALLNNVRFLNITTGAEAKRTKNLSSGYRINGAADDAAGLSISEKMRRQIRGLDQASINAQDGISMCQTAEGALNEVHDMLHRMSELSVKAANGTNSKADRTYLQQEVAQLKTEFDRIASTTTFNDRLLLDGSLGRQTGTNNPKHRVPSTSALYTAGLVSVQSGMDERPSNVTVTVMEALKADQTPALGSTTGGSQKLKDLLKTELVPNAVDAIIDTFSDTFGYLRGSEIGIGLSFKDDIGDSVLASVSAAVFMDRMSYSLTVNTAYYDGSEESRTALERTIAHEMMHALMSEALTSGTLGVDQNSDPIEGFPSWFIEGTAQLISGAFEENNNWIEYMGLNSSLTETEIEDRLNWSFNRLGSGTGQSEYGTGYLAVMYLGYLISGSGSLDTNSIAEGVDALLNTIRGGASLSTAIGDLTKYNGYDDFLNQFSKDAAAFTRELITMVENGTGSLITGSLKDSDLLQNGTVADASVSKLFELNTESITVLNDYSMNHPDHKMIEGGALKLSGEVGMDYQPSDVADSTDPGDGGDPVVPGGGDGGDPVVPGGGDGDDPVVPGGGGDPVNPGGSTVILQGGITLQIGADSGRENTMTIYFPGVSTALLGLSQVDISTREGAEQAIDRIKKAVDMISSQRSEIGAYQNRLEHTIRNLNNIVENTSAAESRIRDTDMAMEMVALSNLQIIRQAGQAILAQSRRSANGIFQLLQE